MNATTERADISPTLAFKTDALNGRLEFNSDENIAARDTEKLHCIALLSQSHRAAISSTAEILNLAHLLVPFFRRIAKVRAALIETAV